MLLLFRLLKLKYLIGILLILLIPKLSDAQTATAKDGNGSDYWTESDSWEDGVIPTCARYSTIIIPSGVTLIVKESVTLNCAVDFIVESGGILRLKSIGNESTIVSLGVGSTVTIETGGYLETDRHNSSNHAANQLIINSNKEWDGAVGDVPGYKKYPVTLPIELLSFKAIAKGDEVEILWSTATETNNDYFTIEKSANGFDFEVLDIVYGQGNSVTVEEYSMIDNNPIVGTSYYRLKQTDYDGKFEVFDLIGVSVEKNTEGDCIVTVYPNPCLGQCTVKMSPCLKNTSGNAKLRIMDGSGRMILTDMPELKSDGSFTYKLNSSNNLAPGVYLIKADANNSSKQLIIRK